MLILTLLIFCAIGVHSRPLDEMDNSIEPSEQRTPFNQDWIKLTKTPPVKLLQPFGSSVEIVCEVMGSQIPTIEWIVGPLSGIDSLESNILSEYSPSAIVRVRSVHVIEHMLSDAQTYTCVGRTGSKTVYASTIVYPQTDLKDVMQLREKPLLVPRKPKIVYSEKLHLDLVGSNIVLPCKVHARPHADVFWMNGEGKLLEQNQRLKVLSTGDLLISDIKWEDMGAYRCIARNIAGKDTADTFVYPVLKEES